MAKQKKLTAICIKDCFDGGSFDRALLEESGIDFREEKAELCRSYTHGQEQQINPNNPIAVHFKFSVDPEVVHEGFHFDANKMQYIPEKPPLTQAQLDRILEDAKREQRVNESLNAQLELEKLREDNGRLRKELDVKKLVAVKENKASVT